MLGTWLYDRILEVEEDRQPSFANLSISNWFNALRFEIISAHGLTLQDQLTRCRDFYNNKLGRARNLPPLAPIFESLFIPLFTLCH